MRKEVLGVDLSSLLRAVDKFETFRENLDTEQEQAGAIQAFEYTYELAWKTMKRILEAKGKTENSPRDVFRAAGTIGLICEPEIWFEFIKVRGIALSAYDRDNYAAVIARFNLFSEQISKLLDNIEKMHDPANVIIQK